MMHYQEKILEATLFAAKLHWLAVTIFQREAGDQRIFARHYQLISDLLDE
jgi:hypothetical protein